MSPSLMFTIATDGELLTNTRFTPGEVFCFGTFDFVVDRFGYLGVSDEGNVPSPVFVGMTHSGSDSLRTILEDDVEDEDMTASDGGSSDFPAARECNVTHTPEGVLANPVAGATPPPAVTPQPVLRLSLEQHEAYQEEQQARERARQIDAAREETQRLQRLATEQVAVETQMAELRQRQTELAAEQGRRVDATSARARARDVAAAINQDGAPRPTFARASQNVAAAAALLGTLPAPSTDAVGQVYHQLREILNVAAEQQAASSLQRRAESTVASPGRSRGTRQRAPAGPPPAGSVAAPARPSVRERLGNPDMRPLLEVRHQARREGEARSEHRARYPRRDGRDDGEGRSLSPGGDGPKAFGRNVRDAPFPRPFRAPSNVVRYDGKTNPSVWLEDYRLACRAGGADDDLFIVQFLPIYLADSARAWLDHLPGSSIDSWEDLRRIFTGNFQGTYVRPGNAWDLKSCRQKAGETLRDYIRRFSNKCHQLPKVGDAEVISAFLSGTSCRDLVHELGRDQPTTTEQLLDIATRYASGEEAVGAVFPPTSGKASSGTGQATPSTPPGKKGGRGGKKGQKRRPRQVAATSRRDDDYGAGGSDDPEHVAAADRDAKRPARPPTDYFEKMLEAPCKNHAFPVRHKLKECDLMKRFVAGAPLDNKGKKPEDAPGGGGVPPFPEEKRVMSIYGGPAPHESRRSLKLTARDVNAVAPATPTYLRWSESPITFDRTDHPEIVPKPGRFPLIVDPLVGTTRLTKSLMDGGSGLNLMYLDTFVELGLSRDQLRPSPHPFYGVVPGKQSLPLGQIDLPVTFGNADNYRTETLTFEVVDFTGPYHIILGRPCYVKFMAIPSYAYLKLKLPGPAGIITVGTKAQQALTCEQDSIELAAAAVAAVELEQIRRDAPLVPAGEAEPSTSGTFKSAEDTKVVQIDPEDPAKTVRIGTGLSPA